MARPLSGSRNFRLLRGVGADARDAQKVAESIDGGGTLCVDPLKHGIDFIFGHETCNAKRSQERRAGSRTSWEDATNGRKSFGG
jgi:hypothetical protein